MKRPMKAWEEYDAFTKWRKYLYWQPGELKRIKRRAAKRERREANEIIKKEYYEYKDLGV